MGVKEQTLNKRELSPFVEILTSRFVQRRDMYPEQLEDGTWITIHEQLHESLLYGHLRGDVTLGTYMLDENSQGRFLVLDADNLPDWRRLQALGTVLTEIGSDSYLEKSRRGGHLWMFLSVPVPGKEIREFGHGLLGYFDIEGIELFPKQDRITTGPGSLVRMPFGIHLKSGHRYGFYLPDGEPLAPTLREQIQALRIAETLSDLVFEQFRSHWLQLEKKALSEVPRSLQQADLAVGEGVPVSERIKAAISVRQFVLRYIELSESGRGSCPFHVDEHPSFSATDSYWTCFAGCGSGSVIDFYMLYQEKVMGVKCDFKTAVKQLAEMLL